MNKQPSRDAILSALPRMSASCLAANGLALPPRRAPEPDMAHDPYDVTCGETKPVKRKRTAKASKPTKPKKERVPKTRNSGTWTEAQYWGRIRSCLRRMSLFWKPAREALQSARVACAGPRGQKWAYVCADCGKLFQRKLVHIDHIEPCGKLTEYAHIGDFLRRLLPEGKDAYAVRCLSCHQAKTNAERDERTVGMIEVSNKPSGEPPQGRL